MPVTAVLFQANLVEEDDRYRVWRSKQQLKFDLTEELRKIHCDQFASPLMKLGYFSRGAFSELTEEILQGSPLFIHRRARVRECSGAGPVSPRHFCPTVSSVACITPATHPRARGSAQTQDCGRGCPSGGFPGRGKQHRPRMWAAD